MRVALVNPPWEFSGSIYFGCREPHLPLELGYAAALLERAGHPVLMLDAHLHGLTVDDAAAEVRAFTPDLTVITTAPSYLFWRCAPPELRIPQAAAAALRPIGGVLAAIGPHGSTSPGAVLRKLGVDLVVLGEAEEVLLALADGADPAGLPAVARAGAEQAAGLHAGRFTDLPALAWPDAWIARHRHHHHRFDAIPAVPGAEVEASRGCPYHCSFCAKEAFRDAYRRRDLGLLLREIDGLIAQGVGYLYFIDEIFLPNRPLLDALAERPVAFGVQTRLDLWKPEMIERLGRAGCVSIEAGVESLTPEGRARLDKDCRMSTEDLTQRLLLAKQHVAFVQANLIAAGTDDAAQIAAWRQALQAGGVWANDPVPMFPYPGTPDYRRRWGPPDDHAWERAVDHYLAETERFSDIQDERPLPLAELERQPG